MLLKREDRQPVFSFKLQVRPEEQIALGRFLDPPGYPHCDESENPAYRLLPCA